MAVEKLRLASLLLRAIACVRQYAALHALPVRLAMLVFEQPGFLDQQFEGPPIQAGLQTVGGAVRARKNINYVYYKQKEEGILDILVESCTLIMIV